MVGSQSLASYIIQLRYGRSEVKLPFTGKIIAVSHCNTQNFHHFWRTSGAGKLNFLHCGWIQSLGPKTPGSPRSSSPRGDAGDGRCMKNTQRFIPTSPCPQQQPDCSQGTGFRHLIMAKNCLPDRVINESLRGYSTVPYDLLLWSAR